MRKFFIGFFSIWAFAQQPRTALLVRVLDPSDAAVPNASVLLTSQEHRQRAYHGRADDQGSFRVALPAGRYELTVEADGFEPAVHTVQLPSSSPVEVRLAIAVVAQQITTTAKAPPLEGEAERRTHNFEEVLEIREVRESAARDVGEALARVQGFMKVRKGGIANDIILRGFQQDNVNVLVDGQRIHGACPNNMDPATFHVDFAEVRQVEVTKGPFDMRNQGSLGGTVSIVSKDPESGARINGTVSTGSYNYWNPSLTASAGTENLTVLAGYSFRRSAPYVDGSGRRFTTYSNYRDTTSVSSAFDVNTGWAKFGWALSAEHRLDISAARQAAGEVLYPYLQMDGIRDDADRLNANWTVNSLGRLTSFACRVTSRE